MTKIIPSDKFKPKYLASVVKIFVLAFFIFTAIQNSVFAQRQLVLINKTGTAIFSLYAVSASYNGWGDNILDSGDFIKDNYSQIINFSDDVRYVKVKAVFGNGKYRYWNSLDLNEVGWIQVDPY